jgi:hypothetical protein
VLGEIRVGIFALRDIKKGEEITFDYQFERFGAFRQRCYCGSQNCRKYLGAKPVNKDGENQKQQQQVLLILFLSLLFVYFIISLFVSKLFVVFVSSLHFSIICLLFVFVESVTLL